MNQKFNILILIGSASKDSSNHKLMNLFCHETNSIFNCTVIADLKTFPSFDPELSLTDPPDDIQKFRDSIRKADGVIICTPEYIFSIPSALKNLFEWSVATTIFENKPVGFITASALGEKGQEELKLILDTVMAKYTPETNLLIGGIKGKINLNGEITDKSTRIRFTEFTREFIKLVTESYSSLT